MTDAYAFPVAPPPSRFSSAQTLPLTTRHAETLLRALDQGAIVALDGATLAAIRQELETALRAPPTPEPEAQRIAFALNAAYPQRDQRSAPEVQAYLAGLADELQRFPRDVAAEAARTVRRSVEFRPSIAEVVKAAEAIQGRRRVLLIGVDRMERERRRHPRAE